MYLTRFVIGAVNKHKGGTKEKKTIEFAGKCNNIGAKIGKRNNAIPELGFQSRSVSMGSGRREFWQGWRRQLPMQEHGEVPAPLSLARLCHGWGWIIAAAPH